MVAMKKNIEHTIMNKQKYSAYLPAFGRSIVAQKIIVANDIRNSFSRIIVISIPY